MPKVRLQKELESIRRESEAAFHIREEFVRWDNVKTAHDLNDDMEVARMLLDCYDLIGGNFLIWSDQAKLAPPPLYATLRLMHVSQEGWEILQEIKELGGWRKDKTEHENPQQRKSKRKQATVRRIEPVQVKKEYVEPEVFEDEMERDPMDDDYMPSVSDDDDEYDPEGGDLEPTRVTKVTKKPKSTRARKPSKKAAALAEGGGEEDSLSKLAGKKRGRPKKGAVRSPPAPKKPKIKKPQKTKPAEGEETGEGKAYKRKTHRIYECKICQVICESQLEFRKHFSLLHGDIEAKMEEGETVKDDTKIEDGEEKTEGDVKKKGGKNQKEGDKAPGIDVTQHATILYRCNPCNMVFKEEDVYKHRTRHDRLYTVCDLCGIMFTSCKSWKAHMTKHDAEKSGNRFICKICGHASIFLKDLKKHMGVHSKVRPHVCEVCGKTFKQRNALYRHRFVHGDVKPYTCEFCGKGFINRYNLKGHVRTHTGEKPYKCNVCNADFTHNVSLKTHKKSAHGIDSWKDKQGNKEFDDFNVEDPNMYTKGKVDTTTPKVDNVDIAPGQSEQTGIIQPSQLDQTQIIPPSKQCHIVPSSQPEPTLQGIGEASTGSLPRDDHDKVPPVQDTKRVVINPPPAAPPPSVSQPNMPPMPVPQGFMQYSEVRQFIPLMLNPYEFAGPSEMDQSASEGPGKSFTNL